MAENTERFDAIVEADIKNFLARMQQVDRAIRDAATGASVQITLNATAFMASMQAVLAQINAVDGSDPNVNVNANIAAALAQLQLVQSQANNLNNGTNTVHVQGNVRDALKELQRVRKQAEDLAYSDIDVRVEVEVERALERFERIQDRIKRLEQAEPSVEVNADIREAMRELNMVEREIQMLTARNHEINVVTDVASALGQLRLVENVTRRLEQDTTYVDIKTDAASALAEMAHIRTQIMQLDASDPTVDIHAETTAFMARLAALQARIEALKADNDVRIDADTSRFTYKMALLRAQLLALNRSAIINIEARINNFQSAIGRLANNIRSFAEVGGYMIGGIFTMLLPMISPIIANIGALLGNLGVIIGLLGTQLTGLVFGVATAAAGAGGVLAMVIGNVQKLYKEGEKLNVQQQEAKSAIDGIKSTYNELVKTTEQPILAGVTKGAQAASSMMQMLEPMFISSAQAFDGLMQSFKQSLGTPPVQAFIEYLNTSAGPMLTTFGKAVGNLLQGLGSMMVAFAPITQHVADGFLNMSNSFAVWAEKLNESKKFEAFSDYFQTNMPKISSMFGDAIVGTVQFFSAFGDSASGMMTYLSDLMERWKKWTATLSENQAFQNFLNYVSQTAPGVMDLIGNLTKFLVNLGIGMAPLGAKLMELVNRFLEWSNALMQSNPIIGQIIAVVTVLAGAFMAIAPALLMAKALFGGLGTLLAGTFGKALSVVKGLFTNFGGTITRVVTWVMNLATKFPLLGTAISVLTGPVGLIIAAVGLFVAALIGVYNTSETFREQVSTAFNAVKEVVLNAFGAVRDFISQVWQQIQQIWEDNSQNITTIASAAWSFITDFITSAMGVIMGIMQFIWPAISTIIQVAWEVIKTAVQVGIEFIGGLIGLVSSVMAGDWQGAWETIKNTAIRIWEHIKSMAETIFNKLKDFLVKLWGGTKTALTKIWEQLKTDAVNKFNELKTQAVNKFNELKTQAVNKANELKTAAVNKFNELKTQASNKVSELKTAAVNKFNELKTAASQKIEEMKQAVVNKFTEAKDAAVRKAQEILSSVRTKFSELAGAVRDKMAEVKQNIESKWNEAKAFLEGIDLTSVGRDVIQGLINGITGMLSSAVSAVSEVASAVVGAAKSVFNTHSPSRVFHQIGDWVTTGLANGITNKTRNAVQSATNVANAVIGATRKALDTHSPSRITTAIGEDVTQGLANGIEDNQKAATTSATKVANEAAKALEKAFNDKMKNLDLRLEAKAIDTDAYVAEAKALAKEYEAVTNATATVNAKIVKASEKEMKAASTAFSKQLTVLNDSYKAGQKTVVEYGEGLTALGRDFAHVEGAAEKVGVKLKSIENEVFNANFDNLAAGYKNGEVAIEDYVFMLELMGEKHGKVNERMLKIDKELATARYELAKQTVDKIVANESMGATAQIAEIERIAAAYAVGTKQREQLDAEAGKIKEAMYSKLSTLNDEYTKKIADAQAKEAEGIKKLNDEYNNAVSQRSSALYSFAGIFDEVTKASDVSGQQLIDNLRGQVDVMKDWAKNMQSLAARGVNEGLIKELQQLGPKSAPEIAALNTLTDAELTEYVSLWQQKSAEASTQAVKELEGMRKDTDKQITALRNETKVQLSQYEREWHTAIRKITDGTIQQFSAAAATTPQIGAQLIRGLGEGMASMKDNLLQQASDIAESVKLTLENALGNAATAAANAVSAAGTAAGNAAGDVAGAMQQGFTQPLDIHSPSRWGDKFVGQNLVQGIINGVTAMQAKAVATARNLSESIKEGITSDLVTADVLGYTAHSTSAINKELAVSVKVEVDGQGGGATQKIENNITVNGGGTANDNARALKRLFVQQGLGMN